MGEYLNCPEYLNQSHHQISVKKGVVNSLLKRATDITNEEYLNEEIKKVNGALKMNGYPRGFVEKVKQK